MVTEEEDIAVLLNATQVLLTETAYIIGVSEDSIPMTIDPPLESPSSKRSRGPTTVTYDIKAAYPWDPLPLILGLAIGIPIALILFFTWLYFYHKMNWNSKIRDCMF